MNWAQEFSAGTLVESDFKKTSPLVWKTKESEIGTQGIVSGIHPAKCVRC